MKMDGSLKSSRHTSEQRLQVDQTIGYTYMNKVLFKSAEKGDMTSFEKYEGHLLFLVDDEKLKNTALHVYSRAGGWLGREFSTNFVQLLVERCPSLLLCPNADGEIPLHIAAKVGNVSMVRFIINSTKQLQHDNEDLEKGTLEATNYSIEQMLLTTDEEGNTPLHNAAKYGFEEMVQLLVMELGRNFSFSANKRGKTPLYVAAKRGNLSSVDIILKKYCNSISIDQYGGPKGRTALHAAVITGNSDIVKSLIDKNKELIEETDDKGRTPLHYAAHLGFSSIVEALLEKDPSVAYITDKNRGSTALHMAAWQGDIRVMEDIIKYCPECCEIGDERGWNFLHFAFVTLSSKEIQKLLAIPTPAVRRPGFPVPCGSDRFVSPIIRNNFMFSPIKDLVNRKNKKGITPLHLMRFGPAYLRLGDYKVKSYFDRYGISESKYASLHREKKIKQRILESLKEIGDIQVASLRVHDSFRMNMEEEEKQKQENLYKARETHLLVATLVATVTFAAAITMPGGYNQDQGTAIMNHDIAFKAFIITDTLAFLFSILAIFLHFLLEYFRKLTTTDFQHRCIFIADGLTFLAMIEMVIAFSTGTYTVLQSSSVFAIVICTLALVFFPGVFVCIYYCREMLFL